MPTDRGTVGSRSAPLLFPLVRGDRLPRWRRRRTWRCLPRPWNAVGLVRLTVDIGWAASWGGRPSRVPSRMAPLLARLASLRDVFPRRRRRGHIGFWRRWRRIGRRRRRRRCGRYRFRLRGAGGQSDCRRNHQHHWYGNSLDHNRLPMSATVDNQDQLAPPSPRLQQTARTLQHARDKGRLVVPPRRFVE